VRGQMSPLLLKKHMISKEYIRQLIENKLSNTDKYLIEIKVTPDNKIFVFIDGDNPVKLQDCIDLSKYIKTNLNRNTDDFELNVSSAGLDQPLMIYRQFVKNIGRNIEILMDNGTRQKGKLINISDNSITIEHELHKKKKSLEKETGKIIKLPLNQIKETKVSILFK
jgi:ribosome maturation factor RimP